MTTKRNFTAEEAQKKFDALPAEIKSLIYTPEVTSVIQKVGEKNKLHFDQMGILEVETSSVMLGFTDTADYTQIITEKLGVDTAKAAQIAQDINDMLFVKIRNSLKASDTEGKSVVMPSSIAAAPVVPAATVVTPTITIPTPTTPTTASVDMQLTAPPMHEVDVMLSEPTVSLAPQPAQVEAPATTPPAVPSVITPSTNIAPSPAPIYKADPYREPIE